MADGSITIDTKIDQKGAEKGVKNLQTKLKNVGSSMKNVGSSMTKWVTGPIAGVGVALGGAMVKFGNFADELLDLSSITGMSTDELQRWRQIATDAGVDTDAVANSLQTLNKQIERGNEISPRLAKGFEAMGVSAEEFKNMGADQQMRNIVETMLELEGADRRAFANQMNMPELLPIVSELESRGKDLDEIMNEIDVPFSQEELDEMNEFRKEWDNLKYTLFMVMGEALKPLFKMFNENKDAIKEKMIPAIQSLVEGAIKLIKWFGDLSPTMQKVVMVVGAVAAAIGPVLVVMGSLISAVAPVIGIIGKLVGAIGLVFNPVTMWIALIGSLATVIIYHWDEIKEYTMIVWNAIKDFFIMLWEAIVEEFNKAMEFFTVTIPETWETIKDKTVEIWQAVSDFFVELWEGIKQFFTDIVTAIVDFFVEQWEEQRRQTEENFQKISDFLNKIWTGIKNMFDKTITAISNFIKKTWDGIQKVTSTVFNAIKDFISKVVNGWKNIITNVLDAIKNTVSKIWNGVKDVTSNVFNATKDVISNIWNSVKKTISNIWNGIRDTISNVVNTIRDRISSAFNSISSTISNVWNGVRSTTDRIWDGIVSAIKGAINGVIGAINGMINGLNRIKIKLPKVPDWVPGMGGKGGNTLGFSIPNIPKLNIGTDLVTQDGLAMLHAGEAVVPAEHNGAYTGEGNGGSKQPAQINLVIGGKTYSAFVEDISDEQDRQNYRLKKK
ncbi:hypothetical protein AQ616_17720 [Oceanobacillus sp. E9]|uniref:hypothetical protein n=1 Tax=Oceanobacillus sp. E9 TaxID=1742575 RepID=UPI00084EA542|nr:hypothetical protein [Oceanobacillus sp. E9]OEH53118.1 hypothetical protein AQ616_17720 [Oceanobacillus sp. E9]